MAAWLAQVDGLNSSMTGDRYPSASAVAASGFVRVTVIGGAQDKYTALQRPVLQLDVLALRTDSEEAPWHQARDICERIKYEAARMVPVTVAPGASWNNARVLVVNMITEARRMEDREGYAHYEMDAQLNYTEVSG